VADNPQESTTMLDLLPEAAPTSNVVTLRLPAVWYHVLFTEIAFGANVHGALNGHSQHNCEILMTMLAEQGGAGLTIVK
jgi:hypothetical protein